MKEFDQYIDEHDFISMKYNYKSGMKYSDIKENELQLKSSDFDLNRTASNNTKSIALIHFNRSIFTNYKFKIFTGVLQTMLKEDELYAYIFFKIKSKENRIISANIFRSYNIDRTNLLYLSTIKKIYETLTLAKAVPGKDNTFIAKFDDLDKEINEKPVYLLDYIYPTSSGMESIRDITDPTKEDSYTYNTNMSILNLLSDIFIQLGCDTNRDLKKEIKNINDIAYGKKKEEPKTQEEPKNTNALNIEYDPTVDYRNLSTSNKPKEIKGHPGFTVYN